MSSIYHILDKTPAIYSEDLQVEYERLANELVNSGRLRIDTDYYCNFVRFSDNKRGISLIFSYDELTDSQLVEKSKQILHNFYQKKGKAISEQKLMDIITDLNKKASKLLLVSKELTLQLARIFVQSAHPIAIKWLLIERVEVFITYSHNIGDVMDMVSWKRSGTNSGMQSTDGSNVCIYVSCGGDPFAKNNENHPTYGDGWAALARLQIIAGQEIGHYADIKRDKNGRQITRHSANFACTKAAENVKAGRKNDINRCDRLYNTLLQGGMKELIEVETQLKFYSTQKVSGPRVWWLWLLKVFHCKKLVRFSVKNNLIFIKRFDGRENYVGLTLAAMIKDMKSQLSMTAEVYKHPDPEAEEAINCAEALARVPQQVLKWGHLTTRATMHDLYQIYYKQVIPSLVENYELFTSTTYKRNYSLPKKTILSRLVNKLTRKLRKKDFKFVEVREIS
ncbi:MAG: DUF2748 family protein [Rickettsiaceae bacterium]